MQNRQTFSCATRSRTRKTVSCGSSSFLSSCAIFPVNMPNAAGIRAPNTFTGVSTLPNCLRVKKYASFIIKPFGFSIGARNGASKSV